jgi:hypothetical protein
VISPALNSKLDAQVQPEHEHVGTRLDSQQAWDELDIRTNHNRWPRLSSSRAIPAHVLPGNATQFAITL